MNAIWEELTNIETISTVKSLQLANERDIDIVVLEPGDDASEYLDPDDDPNTGHSAAFINQIQADLNANQQKDYEITIPVLPTGLGEFDEQTQTYNWEGVGYLTWLEDGGAISAGYIISGGFSAGVQELSHGGIPAYDTPSTPKPKLNTSVSNSTQTIAGDPINVANGCVWHDETDISFPGLGFPLQFSRHYDSGQTDNLDFDSDRGLGEGWSFTYSDCLQDGIINDPAGTKVWYTGQGERPCMVYSRGRRISGLSAEPFCVSSVL